MLLISLQTFTFKFQNCMSQFSSQRQTLQSLLEYNFTLMKYTINSCRSQNSFYEWKKYCDVLCCLTWLLRIELFADVSPLDHVIVDTSRTNVSEYPVNERFLINNNLHNFEIKNIKMCTNEWWKEKISQIMLAYPCRSITQWYMNTFWCLFLLKYS